MGIVVIKDLNDYSCAVFDGAGRFSILQLSNGAARLEADLGKIEAIPRLEGRQMVMMINPVKH